MNKKQADAEAKKIFQEHNKKANEIEQRAKEAGTWKQGLDSNKDLFVDLEKETKEKLKILASKISKD